MTHVEVLIDNKIMYDKFFLWIIVVNGRSASAVVTKYKPIRLMISPHNVTQYPGHRIDYYAVRSLVDIRADREESLQEQPKPSYLLM